MTRPDLDRAHIQRLLAVLGNSGREVANSLRRRGFVGVREDGCRCPVANYLRSHGVVDVKVMKDEIEDDRDEQWANPDRWRMPTPEPIAEFIREFDDACLYDDLEVQP